ncbi:ferritin family protein [Candidatus Omnitrophota bacterium]
MGNNVLNNTIIAFLMPGIVALIIYPIARRKKLSWVIFLITLLCLSLGAVIIKELINPDCTRDTVIADVASLFLGVGCVGALFYNKNKDFAKDSHIDHKSQEDNSLLSAFVAATRQGGMKVSLRELLNVSLTIEKRGEDFYRKASNVVSDPNVRELCRRLSYFEARHAEKIAAVLNQWLPRAPRPRFVEWTEKYIKKHTLFMESFNTTTAITDVLKSAIATEEITQKFYTSLKHSFPDFWKRQHLEYLIQEEAEHREMLTTLLEKIKK